MSHMSNRSHMSHGRRAGQRVERAGDSPAIRWAARGGLVARGVLYILVGVLALQIAFGHGGKEADRTGALQTVRQSPGGGVILWLLAAGFAGLAIWRYFEAALGQPVPGGRKPAKRLVSLSRAILYTVVCGTTIAFIVGSG